jgi:enterochelin esterase-like enzyme
MDHAGGAWCRDDALSFRLHDPDRRYVGVRLSKHARIPGDGLDFTYHEGDGSWLLTVPRPPVWRLEYQFELRHADGGTELICDPDNPRRVGGAYGDKSVLECPEYVEPAWLHQPGVDGSWRELTIAAPALKTNVQSRIWSPADHTDLVLIANDGPEYDRFAALGHFAPAMMASGRVPPHHLILLAPGDRNEWYSANPAYAWTLVADVIPRLYKELGTQQPVVAMGASLGGLAMLHAQRRYPAAFAGLFLQSSSFFRPRRESYESWFPRYLRIVRFTGRVLRSAEPNGAVPTVLTCGRAEENLANNRAMADALRRQGYPVELFEVPDAHNYTGWRDAFDPYLTDLLRWVWCPEETR